jgi:hypothetical protein
MNNRHTAALVAEPALLRSMQGEVAYKLVGDVYNAIGPFRECSEAFKAALASRWLLTITPPDEIVLACGVLLLVAVAAYDSKHLSPAMPSACW